MRQIFAVAMVLAVSIAGALAQAPPKPGSPAANFRDDVLLRKARVEIVQMHRHELDLLTDLLATCRVTGIVKDDAANRLCQIAYERYHIAYSLGRPIDRILFAYNLMESIVRVGYQDKRRQGQDIKRLVEITHQLGDAVSVRNHGLARQIGTR